MKPLSATSPRLRTLLTAKCALVTILAAPTAATAADFYTTLSIEEGGSGYWGSVDRVSSRRYTVRSGLGEHKGSIRLINTNRWSVHAVYEGRIGTVRRSGSGWAAYWHGYRALFVQRSGTRRWTIRSVWEDGFSDYGYVQGSTIGPAAAGVAMVLGPQPL